MSIADRDRKRQELRGKIDGCSELEKILGISEELYKCAKLGNINRELISALRASADIKLRVLAKVLPDLKSVEQDVGEGLAAMTTEELDARVRKLIDRLDRRGMLGGARDPAQGAGSTLQ